MRDAPRFIGREPQLDVLHRAWTAARQGQTRVVAVEGEAGIGKTALLRHFRTLAAPHAHRWVSGDPDETALPWAVLGRLVPGVEAADVAYAGRAVARELGQAGELLIVVDDAHWADQPSLTALRLALRSMTADPVLVVLASQADTGVAADDGWRRIVDGDRGERLVLRGLDAAELTRFALAGGHPLSPAGAARLHEHTAGHPLHAQHVLDRVPPRVLAHGDGPLPAPAGVSAVIADRVAALSPAARRLVEAGAVLGTEFPLRQARELADLAPAAGAVAEAVAARLLSEVPGAGGHELAFTATLSRSVVYHGLDPSRRRELHRRAAEVDHARAVAHLVAGADGPDEELAQRVAAEAAALAGQQAPGRQAHQAAAYLRHSADLTPPGPARTVRLFAACEALLVAGDLRAADGYAAEISALPPAPWRDYLCGYHAMVSGRTAEARQLLERALAGADGELTARVAVQLAVIAIVDTDYDAMIGHGRTALSAAREPSVASFAWFARSVGLTLTGAGQQALAELPAQPPGLDGLVARGMIRLWTDDLAGAYADLSGAVARAVRGEALRVGQAPAYLGETEFRRGNIAEAVLHTTLAVGDAEANGRVWDFSLVHALAAYPLAAQGDPAAVEHAEQARTWARRIGSRAAQTYAALAQAAVSDAAGDLDGLLAAATAFERVYDSREPGTHLFGPLLADALARTGRAEAAQAALDRFTARPVVRVSARAAVARVQARLLAARGDLAGAVARCAAAQAFAETAGLPLEAARAAALSAGYLVGAGRRAAAERAWRFAHDRYADRGAHAYADRVRADADAAGLPLTGGAVWQNLTPAERAVVNLVCEGLSNREIAARLVLSPKTVETHLSSAFRRLDVTGRAELRSLAAAGPGWSPPNSGVAP
ncbi:LuxR family transcriptional regulator [Catellatospora sp. TT07R-123]|uniref:ATP-binding protein n=1 Tax=Catellatospora sp. TT07R-123 TaxID=2733863 RepID=UPI001B14FC78|nr:LuxR family transcriptional regulator [Catellatospora sp. TT07R-123]GHJ43649.1 LuxR family transcriptional regulator [Catellatospora sp. TT07R-123]